MWLDAIRHDRPLADALGLVWLEEEQRALWKERWRASWSSAFWDEAFLERGRAVLERCQIVATGPTRTRRSSGEGCPLWLVHDPERDELALLFSLLFPPMGMPSAGRTADSLRQAMGDWQRQATAVTALPRVLRLVKPLELQSVEAVLRTIEVTEPWMDDGWWGSAHDEDPHDELPPEANFIQKLLVQRRSSEQHPGRMESWSLRSLWSRSQLRIERHPFGLWVFEARYLPVQDSAAGPSPTERLSGDAAFPPDLPVDLLPSLLREETLTPAVVPQLLAEPDPLPYYLAALCALGTGDPGMAAQIEPYAARFIGTPDEGSAVDILAAYGCHLALVRLGLLSPSLRGRIEAELEGVGA